MQDCNANLISVRYSDEFGISFRATFAMKPDRKMTVERSPTARTVPFAITDCTSVVPVAGEPLSAYIRGWMSNPGWRGDGRILQTGVDSRRLAVRAIPLGIDWTGGEAGSLETVGRVAAKGCEGRVRMTTTIISAFVLSSIEEYRMYVCTCVHTPTAGNNSCCSCKMRRATFALDHFFSDCIWIAQNSTLII